MQDMTRLAPNFQCFSRFYILARATLIGRHVIVGEVVNFVAYVYAPAVLVTPLGAMSIIISAILAHFLLKERLSLLGVMGCVCCIVGYVVIVLHAPQEESPSSVLEVWALTTELVYLVASISIVATLILHFQPLFKHSNVLVYLGICSFIGSLTVVSIKVIGVAIKLTPEGTNQFVYPQTWFFLTVAAICVVTQLNYLNNALDTFNAAIVSPIYYVMFTTLTIAANAIIVVTCILSHPDWLPRLISSNCYIPSLPDSI
ncbi:hypothetical protein V2J09_017082 [Rumex salicifolius]